MFSDIDTLRQFLLRVQQWPPEQRADLPHVVASLESAHPTLYAALIEGLASVPVAMALWYGEALIEIPPANRPWFRLLVMELYECARK
jgi:hypothetical protein